MARLRGLISHASTAVPYYVDAIKPLGIDPATLSVVDFQRLPVLTREQFQLNQESMIALGTDRSRARVASTSGTTGTPLNCVKTPWESLLSERLLWKARLEWDDDLMGATSATVGASVGVSGGESLQVNGKHSMMLVNLNPLHIVDDFRKLTENLNRLKPEVIASFVNTLVAYIELIEDGEVKGIDYSPKLIEVTGEFLNRETKKKFTAAFGCPVVNKYACTEVHTIAYSCRKEGMHVSPHIALEKIPADDLPGIGEIVVTSTLFRAMPFVRYRLGDLISEPSQQCTCGSPTPTIDVVQGRTSEAVGGYRGLIGTIIFPLIMRRVLMSAPRGIRRYRVIQRSKERFDILIVPGVSYNSDLARDLVNHTTATFGQVDVHVLIVSSLPIDQSGKSRLFVNNSGMLP